MNLLISLTSTGPPGKPGLPGLQGLAGEKGEAGFKGERGNPGKIIDYVMVEIFYWILTMNIKNFFSQSFFLFIGILGRGAKGERGDAGFMGNLKFVTF